MVAAVLLIALALVLILIWMIVITILYCHLAKIQRVLKQSLLTSTALLEEGQSNILEALDYFLYYFENLTGDAENLYKEASNVLEIATEKAAHARDTAQAARKLKAQICLHKLQEAAEQKGGSDGKDEENQSSIPADTPKEE